MQRLRQIGWLALAAAIAAFATAAMFGLFIGIELHSWSEMVRFGAAALQIAGWIAMLGGLPILIALHSLRRLTILTTTIAGGMLGAPVPLLLSSADPSIVSACIVLGALSALAGYPAAKRSNNSLESDACKATRAAG